MTEPRSLDAKAAAEAIRDKIINTSDVSPEERHMSTFAADVCEELDLDPGDPIDLIRVARALHEEGITPHLAMEYPKMLLGDDGRPLENAAGKPIVVQNEDDEDFYREHGHMPDEPRADTDRALAPQRGPRDPTHDNKPNPLRGVRNPDDRNDANRQSDPSGEARDAMHERPNDLQPDPLAEASPNRSRSKQTD